MYAGLPEIDLLSFFLRKLYDRFPQSACIIIQPHTDTTDETLLYNEITSISFLQVQLPTLNMAIEAGGLYFIAARKQLLLQHGSFVSFNFWNDSPNDYISIFCRYLATHFDRPLAFIAFHAIYSKFFEAEIASVSAANTGFWVNTTINDRVERTATERAEQVDSVFSQLLQWCNNEAKAIGGNLERPKAMMPVNFNLGDYLQHAALSLLCLDTDLNIRKYTTSLFHYISIDNSFVGKHLCCLDLPPTFNFLPQTAQNVLKTRVASMQNLVHLPSGERCIIDIYPAFERQNNYLKGVVIILSDQTEHLRTKEQLEGMRLNIEQQGRAYWQAKAEWIKENIKNALVVKRLDSQTELLYGILARMTEGIIALDDKGSISLINQSAMNLLGIEGEVGRSLEAWTERCEFFDDNGILPQSRNPFIQALHKDMSGPTEVMVKNNLTNQSIYLSINVQLLPRGIDDNDNEGRLMVIRDISKRKKAEQKEKAIIKAVPDMMFTMNRQGVFINIYDNGSASLPYMDYFLAGNNVGDIYGEIAEGVYEAIENAINTKELQTVEFRSVNDVKEKLEYSELRISPIGQDQVLGLVRDITDIVEGKHTREHGMRHFRELLDNVPIPIILLNQQGEIVYHNALLPKMLHWAEDIAIISQNVFDYVNNNITRAKNGLANLFREKVSKKVSRFELQIGDRTLVVDITGKLINYDNVRVAQISILKITEITPAKSPNLRSKSAMGKGFWGVITFEMPSFVIHSYSKKLTELLPKINSLNLLSIFELYSYTNEFQEDKPTIQEQLAHLLAETEKNGQGELAWAFDKNGLTVKVVLNVAYIVARNNAKLFSLSIFNR